MAKESRELAITQPTDPTPSPAQRTEEVAAPESSNAHVPRAPIRRAIYRAFHTAWTAMEGLALILSFAGIVYLAYDTYYRTGLGVDFAYSDAVTAINDPITLTNESNLFTMRNINWECAILSEQFEHDVGIANIGVPATTGNIEEILPGGVLNISCNGPSEHPVFAGTGKLINAKVKIALWYDAHWGPLRLQRAPHPMLFSWVGSIALPRWIKGATP